MKIFLSLFCLFFLFLTKNEARSPEEQNIFFLPSTYLFFSRASSDRATVKSYLLRYQHLLKKGALVGYFSHEETCDYTPLDALFDQSGIRLEKIYFDPSNSWVLLVIESV